MSGGKRPRPWPGMPGRYFTALGEYARDLADKLNLRDRKIVMMHEPLPSDSPCGATVRIPSPLVVEIRLARDFARYSREDQRAALVHELVHAHTIPIKTAATTWARGVAEPRGSGRDGAPVGAHRRCRRARRLLPRERLRATPAAPTEAEVTVGTWGQGLTSGYLHACSSRGIIRAIEPSCARGTALLVAR